jgi:hypothetical protein
MAAVGNNPEAEAAAPSTANHDESANPISQKPSDPDDSTKHLVKETTSLPGTPTKETEDPTQSNDTAKPKEGEHDDAKAETAAKSNDDDTQKKDKPDDKDSKKKDDKDGSDTKSVAESEPPGGYDATPIPKMPPGYTIQITIHRAKNLPMADINTLSSDPYVITQVYTDNPTRHKEDPALKMRTFTVRKEVNPEWNARWVVANVPASGFRLKCRIYDEDPADHDDRLGNAHINVPRVSDDWKGFKEQSFKIKKRMGSKRAYAAQAAMSVVGIKKGMDGYLIVSIENLGRTESRHGGRLYTVGPAFWIKHYSPLLGRVMGQKTPGKDEDPQENENEELVEKSDKDKKAKSERYK